MSYKHLLVRLLFCLTPAAAQNEPKTFSAKNGAFTFSAPAAFQDISNAPPNALVALEVPGFGVSFLSQREKAEEVETEAAQSQARKRLTESGATVLGTARADLAGPPSACWSAGCERARSRCSCTICAPTTGTCLS
jgi:hypothetical protein